MPKRTKYLIDHSSLWHDSSFDSMQRSFHAKRAEVKQLGHDILEDIDTISRICGLLAHHPLAHAEEKLDDQIWFDLADAGQEESWYRSQVGKLWMTKENRIRRVKVTPQSKLIAGEVK